MSRLTRFLLVLSLLGGLQLAQAQDCAFTGPAVEVTCDDDATVDLLVAFENIVSNNDFVDVFIDDAFVGFYPNPVGEPILIDNVGWQGQASVQLTVCVNDNEDCCYTQDVDLPNCTAAGCVGFEYFTEEFAAFQNAGSPLNMVYYQENGISFTKSTASENGQVLLPNDGGIIRFAPGVAGFTNSIGISIGHVNTSSVIDFTNFSTPVNTVSLDFIHLNGEDGPFNVQLNDGTIHEFYVPNVPNALELEPGVTVVFTGPELLQGRLIIINNNINTVRVGGGMVMDNLCVNQEGCLAEDALTVTQMTCGFGADSLVFSLDVAVPAHTSETFELYINGELYEVFPYAGLPYTELLAPTGFAAGDTLEMVIVDQVQNQCSATDIWIVENCSAICNDWGAEVLDEFCQGEMVWVQIGVSDAQAGWPVAIEGLSSNTRYEITVQEAGNLFLEIPTVELDPEGYLITNIFTGCVVVIPPLETVPGTCPTCDYVLDANTSCVDATQFSAILTLTSNSGQIPLDAAIFVNGEFYGSFAGNTVELAGLPAGQEAVVDVVIDDGFCAVSTNLVEQCGEDCNLFQPQILELSCEGDTLLFWAGFELGAEPGDQIQVTNGSLEDVYTISENGYIQVAWPLVHPYDPTFVFTHLGNDCLNSIDIDLPNDCVIPCEDFIVDWYDWECFVGEDFITLTLNISEELQFGEPLLIQNLNTGYSQMPDFVGEESAYVLNWPVAEEGTIRFSALWLSCSAEFEFVLPSECATPCIDNFAIVETSCENGFTQVEFVAIGGSSDQSFTVTAGDVSFTQFYGQDSYTFQLPLANGEEVNVQFVDNESGCQNTYGVEGACFCIIEDINYEIVPCDENGLWYIETTFTAAGNWDPATFTVTADNASSQTFSSGTYTTLVGPFPSAVTETVLRIFSNADHVEACNVQIPINYTCDSSDDCSFTDIFAEGYACDEGQFLVDVEFNNPNGGDLGFYIFGDGMIFGPFAYGETFYTFGPLDGSVADHTIMLLDIANPACFGNYDLTFACSDECLIQEVVVSASDCESEFFSVTLEEVVGQNLGTLFTVVGNGQNYGTFSYDDLPVVLGDFVGDGDTVYEFGVIDLLNPTCTSFTGLGPINCAPCNIRDLTYEVDCGSEGYALTVDFIYENPVSNFFVLELDGEIVESFSYESLPLTIDLPLSINTSLAVYDADDLACRAEVPLDIPCCNFNDATATVGVSECTGDGTFYLEIGEIDGLNLSDSVTISYAPAGASIIVSETVTYDLLPTVLGPVPGDGLTAYTVIIQDAIQQCAITTTVDPVFCDNGACVEFEGVMGVWGPLLGDNYGEGITVENEVVVSLAQNLASDCTDCNLLITDGIPNINFGSGHIAVTDNSGLGLDFTQVTTSFNTISIDYYYANVQGIGVQVNGQDWAYQDLISNLTENIAPGVSLQVIENGDDTGTLVFSGDDIATILLFSANTAAFDNVCLSMTDNVWPGDTNSDNVASHFDLLNVGLAFGETGPSRSEQTDDWAGLVSAAWANNFADGLNYKHADANGDGTIDLLDREVIDLNYGLAHGPVDAFEELSFTDLDPLISVETADLDALTAGESFDIPIVVGEEGQEVEDLYGLAFTIQLDPEIIDMENIQVLYPTSWFGDPAVNATNIHRIYPDGRIEIGITRTDRNNVSGHGTVAQLRGIIIDDIILYEGTNTDVEVEDIFGVDKAGTRKALRPNTTELLLTSTQEVVDRETLRNSFKIYPNPTGGQLFFTNDYGMAPDRIVLYTALGQRVTALETPEMNVDFSELAAGTYWLEIHLEGFIFTEKIVKL